MRLALITEVIYKSGSILNDILLGVDLTVDHTKRISLESVLAVITHGIHVRSEVILQYLVISSTALGAADRIDMQSDML